MSARRRHSRSMKSAFALLGALAAIVVDAPADPVLAERYPLALWESFDHPDGTTAVDLGFTQAAGSTLFVETGELTSSGGGGSVLQDLGLRPERVESMFYPSDSNGNGALLVRAEDLDNNYLVKLDVTNERFELYEVVGGVRTLLADAAIPFIANPKSWHGTIVVDDTGTDLVCRLLDYSLTIRASDGGADFNNDHLDATSIGLKNFGSDKVRCRFLRAWKEIPAWDGVDQVAPAWGAQHIWTKVQQRYVGTHDRTYWGWATVWGSVEMRWYDHGLKQFGPIETIYRYPGDVTWAYDDHHPPGIYVHDDGRVWAWIQSHKSDDPFILLRSQNPEDISAWQPAVDMTTFGGAPASGVYPRAHRVANGDVLLFHRVGGSSSGEWHLRRSTDDGQTWDNTKIIDNSEGHVYQFIRQDPADPDHIVLVGNHKDTATNPDSWRRAYVWETTDGGASFQTLTDDQPIALPASRSDLEPVFLDATHQLFVTGQAIRPDGTPMILAAYRDDPNHEIVALFYDAGQWRLATIAPSIEWPGSVNYAAPVWRPSGGDVNPADPDEVAIAVAVNGVHEIQRWRTDDGGYSWAKTAEVTRNSVVKNFRPRYVENAHPSDWNLLWHGGEFYGTTVVPSGGRHFDRYDDVLILNELLVDTAPDRGDKVRPRLMDYAAWRSFHNLPSGPDGDAGGDYDGDGLSNSFERISNTSPDSAADANPPELIPGDPPALQLSLHPAFDGDSLLLDLSDDLSGWTRCTTHAYGSAVLPGVGPLEQWRFYLPSDETKGFIRVVLPD